MLLSLHHPYDEQAGLLTLLTWRNINCNSIV